MSIRRRKHRGARWLGYGLVVALGLFFVARAVVELVTVDRRRPETYRDDWGGPHYLGVLLVHVGPAVVVVILAAVFAWRHRRAETAAEQPSFTDGHIHQSD